MKRRKKTFHKLNIRNTGNFIIDLHMYVAGSNDKVFQRIYPFVKYCDYCYHSLRFVKKINQSKYRYYCDKCKTHYNKCLQEGIEICDKCKGHGYISKFKRKVCSNCDGRGTTTWTQKIIEGAK